MWVQYRGRNWMDKLSNNKKVMIKLKINYMTCWNQQFSSMSCRSAAVTMINTMTGNMFIKFNHL